MYSSIRWQFHKFITPQGIDFRNVLFEEYFNQILNKELLKFNYDYSVGFVFKTFIKDFDSSAIEINSEIELENYINKIVTNLLFHKKEIFPKLLDINFLAEYIGAVSFERKAERSVGGKFPVHLFKKIAILKLGGQNERYLEYKEGTLDLIKSYAIRKPEKYLPSFREGFDKLILHLENEENPFDNLTLT
ncbi:hypothetical protein [Zobellia laminariae]|uniref:hypothetical protein n=1 Tax=Zobellia laminariae TaxID=248906 RepID=UPI0026F419E2|nr:hypothetical protein [Zobellia laminariae]WKX78228.1 hypothetical protein Q5W13_10175 [Zobellia laminariae]